MNPEIGTRDIRYDVQFNGHTIALFHTGHAGEAPSTVGHASDALACLPNFIPSNGYRIMATVWVDGEEISHREVWPGPGGGITVLIGADHTDVVPPESLAELAELMEEA